MLKDHLGNVRMVLTEEQEQTKYPYASLEDAKLATEQTYYDINPAYIRNTQTNPVSGLPTYINNNNGIGNNPHDAGFDQTNSQKLYRINGNENKTGLGITLKVMAGDKIDIFGSSYYSQSVVNNGTCATCGLTAANLVAAFLNAPGAAATTGAHGAVTPALVATQAGSNITSILQSNQNSQAANNSNRPKAFINYILFDEQFKYTGGGASMVAGAYTLEQHFNDLQNIQVPKNGYIYIYCSNESNVDVFFDNLQVVHGKGAILEETHYYPFGLTMAGISSKAAGGIQNKKKFNAYELQSQEFSDGSGLEWYDYKNRFYDNQIGRFFVEDRLASQYVYYSPYQFAGNEVPNAIDLDGLEPYSSKDLQRQNENRGESTQIKPPVDCRNCSHTQATPVFTLTITKGKQAGIKVAGVGGEINAGSKEVLKVSDADPGKNEADKNKVTKGASLSIGVVSASKESNSKSTDSKTQWGTTNTLTITETTRNLSFGIKKTPISAGIENTETSNTISNGIITTNLGSTTTGPQLYLSASPSEVGGKTSKGTEFSISLYYKVEIKVDFKQMLINIFNDFNTGGR